MDVRVCLLQEGFSAGLHGVGRAVIHEPLQGVLGLREGHKATHPHGTCSKALRGMSLCADRSVRDLGALFST